MTSCHTPAKFSGCRYCGRGDIVVLVCPVILQDHLIKGSSKIMGRSPSRLVTILSSVVPIRYSDGGDIMVLVCHVTLQDHMIKG